MAVFVGVDQALRKIGVSVIEDGRAVLLKLIVPPPDLRDTPRMQYLREALEHTLEPFHTVDGAAMEGQSYGSAGQLDQLGRIAGIVEVLLADRFGKPPLIVPPATLKKFVTGSGRATKSMMMRATKVYWDLEVTQDDICDAHGLARVAEEFYAPQSQHRHQLEAVHTLRRGKKKKKRFKSVFPKTL
jgi:Holliday junction resolvasome RuvABC endonuclease subunit